MGNHCGVQPKKSAHRAVLRDYLRASGLSPGDKLPGEREIANALGWGRTLLRPLLSQMETDGFLVRRPQSGTFLIALPPPDSGGVRVALLAPFQGTGEPQRNDAFWFHRVAAAFERVAISSGAQLLFFDQSARVGESDSVKAISREIISTGVDAAVLLHPSGTRETISRALALLHDAHVHPLILSARTYPGLASQVYMDGEWGTYLATAFVLSKGHKRIGFAGASPGHEWVRERRDGFQSALAASEIPPDPTLIWLPGTLQAETPVAPVTGENALDYFASIPSERQPTALVAANDVIALGILRRAHALGISVPDDLSVIGFDNDPGALLAGLTTVERPAESLGETAARVVLERIAAGMSSDTVSHRIRPVIVERGTVGVLKTKISYHSFTSLKESKS